MEPSDVDVPRSIMDPAPTPQRRAGGSKKLFILIGVGITVLLLIGFAGFWVLKNNDSSKNESQANSSESTQPTPTPEPDITETATTKQVAVEGRTFTHIVPKTWDTTASTGDLASPEFTLSGDSSSKSAVAAIRYNQGTYALNAAAPANTLCNYIAADSEVVKVSPDDERYINYCSVSNDSGEIFTYVLFTKYSYKKGKKLTATEQSDLLQNVLLYGRIQSTDDETFDLSYAEIAEEQSMKDMIEIFRSIEYVEVQG
jgi:hypothetical protein